MLLAAVQVGVTERALNVASRRLDAPIDRGVREQDVEGELERPAFLLRMREARVELGFGDAHARHGRRLENGMMARADRSLPRPTGAQEGLSP